MNKLRKVISGVLSATLITSSVISGTMVSANMSSDDELNNFVVDANTKVWTGNGIYIASNSGGSIMWGSESDKISTDISQAVIKEVYFANDFIYMIADFKDDEIDGYRLFSNDNGDFKNVNSQLGLIDGLEDVEIEQFQIGNNHGIALDSNNDIWMWGYNSGNCMSDTDVNTLLAPYKVESEKIFGKDTDIKKVGAGYVFNVVLSEDGEIAISGLAYGAAFTESSQTTGFEYISRDKYLDTMSQYEQIDNIYCGSNYIIYDTHVGHYICGNTPVYDTSLNGTLYEAKMSESDNIELVGVQGMSIWYTTNYGNAYIIENENDEYTFNTILNADIIYGSSFGYGNLLAVVKVNGNKYKIGYIGNNYGNAIINGESNKSYGNFVDVFSGNYIYDNVNNIKFENEEIVDNVIELKKGQTFTVNVGVYPQEYKDNIKVRIDDKYSDIIAVSNTYNIVTLNQGYAEVTWYIDGADFSKEITLAVLVDEKTASSEPITVTTVNNKFEQVEIGKVRNIKLKVVSGEAESIVGFDYSVNSGESVIVNRIYKSDDEWYISVMAVDDETTVITLTETGSGGESIIAFRGVDKLPDDYETEDDEDEEDSEQTSNKIAKELKYDFTSKEYEVGEKFTIIYPNVTPENAYQAFTVSIDNGITKVDKYYVGYEVGTYKVTVTEEISGLSASYTINIVEPASAGINIADSFEVIYGTDNELSYELIGDNADMELSYNTGILRVEVDELSKIINIRAKSKNSIGTSQGLFITVTDDYGVSITKIVNLKIVDISENTLQINEKADIDEVAGYLLPIGEIHTLTVSYSKTGDIPSYKDITWSSSNRNVARVDSYGNIYGVKSGTCIITVEDKNKVGYSDSIEVTVMSATDINKYYDTEPTEIMIVDSELEVLVGETKAIRYEIIHLHGFDQIYFEALTDNITVTGSGMVTGLSNGIGIVRIYSDSGTLDETININVKYADNYWNEIVNPVKMSVGQDIIVTFTRNLGLVEVPDGTVWVSSDEYGNDSIVPSETSVNGNRITIKLDSSYQIDTNETYYIFVTVAGLKSRIEFNWNK